MPRGQCTFRQRDLTAAIKAAKAAGYEVQRFEIDRDTGKISVFTCFAPLHSDTPARAEPEENEWDDE